MSMCDGVTINVIKQRNFVIHKVKFKPFKATQFDDKTNMSTMKRAEDGNSQTCQWKWEWEWNVKAQRCKMQINIPFEQGSSSEVSEEIP